MENESEQSGGGPLVAWETLMNPSHNQSPPKQNIIKRLTSKILQDIHPFYKAHSLTDLSNLNLTREEDVHEAIRRIWLLEKGKSANGDLEKFLVEQMSKLYPPPNNSRLNSRQLRHNLQDQPSLLPHRHLI